MINEQSIADVLPNSYQFKVIYVNISKIVIGFSNEILRIPALGSCIGLVIYPRNVTYSDRIAVMGHIMLPESRKKITTKTRTKNYPPAKYSDQAVPTMIAKLEKLGYSKRNLIAKMVGGAKMFVNNSDVLDIGRENTRATIKHLQEYKIPLVKHYTGGDRGMKVIFKVKDYEMIVTPAGGSPIIL